MSRVRPAVLRGKKKKKTQKKKPPKDVSVGDNTQTVQPILFIPAMLKVSIDFYHFVPLSLTLAWPCATGSAQSKTYWFRFSHISHLIKMKFDVVMKQFKLNVPSKIFRRKGNNCCFTDYLKNNNKKNKTKNKTTNKQTKQNKTKQTLTSLCIRMFMNGFDSNLVS